MQPPGYLHSLGFLDQARYARYQFRRLGAEVTIGKNRLREDSVNIIFGAHLGFPASLKQRYTCVFFNLEQLGEGGARVSQDYMDLLTSSAVMDYDERNLAAYGCKAGDVPVVSFAAAPYLASDDVLPLENRPIDLLFFGSMNDRRRALIQRIEACGWNVAMFDQPLYCEERDHFIRQSKAVFNCHFYETSRFEQARAFHTLSLGTPVVSERTQRTQPPVAFEDAVSWVTDESLEEFFSNEFMSSQWVAKAHSQMANFSEEDPLQAWQVAFEYALAIRDMSPDLDASIWRPAEIRVGGGQDDFYKPGVLNLNAQAATFPDLLLDMTHCVNWPINKATQGGGRVCLQESTADKISARFEHMSERQWYELLRNCLHLLKTNGCLDLELNFTQDLVKASADELAKQLGAMPWFKWVEQFWHLGTGAFRFAVTEMVFVNAQLQACQKEQARFILIRLIKSETTLHEQTMSRVALPGFGGIPEDAVIGAMACMGME